MRSDEIIQFSFYSPIFQTEDIQKLQLIPLQKPLITSNNLHERLLQPENESVTVHQPRLESNTGDSTSAIAIANDPHQQDADHLHIDENDHHMLSIDCDDHPILPNPSNTNSLEKSIKQNKRLEKKRQKQQQKQLKKLNKELAKEKKRNETINARAKKAALAAQAKSAKSKNNKQLTSNLKQHSNGNEPQVPCSSSSSNGRNSCSKQKPSANVKFAIDTVDNSADAIDGAERPSEHMHHYSTDLAIIENGTEPAHDRTMYAASNHSGDYDALAPSINVDTVSAEATGPIQPCNNEIYDGNGNVIQTNGITVPIGCSSSECIPYIDVGLNGRRATSVPIETRNRFITLQPRGIGAQGIIYARKIEKSQLPIAVRILPKRDQFDKSAQILYQSLKESIDHHFERAAHLNSKLCQVCHEFLLVPDAVKCLTCGLVCHHSCTLPQVWLEFELFFCFSCVLQGF